MKDAQTNPPWDDRARLLRVMAHPVRLMILRALCERPQCVKDINSLVPIVQPHLSQHMAALRFTGLFGQRHYITNRSISHCGKCESANGVLDDGG